MAQGGVGIQQDTFKVRCSSWDGWAGEGPLYARRGRRAQGDPLAAFKTYLQGVQRLRCSIGNRIELSE